jgi:hypothetical protein
MTRRRIAVLLGFVLATGVAALLVESEDERRTELAATGYAPTELSVAVAEAVASTTPPDPNDIATEPLEARDWLRSRQESADDFALAEELAAAALQGDARAHYVLGELLLRCEVSKRTLAPYQDAAVADRMERYIADNAIALEHSRQALRTEVSRCARLFSADPFAQFDLPAEARDFRYWAKRAVDLGDPIAVMDRTLRLAAGRGVSDDSEQELRQALLGDVRVAVDSREPAALFMVGTLFSQPAITTSSEVGLAWHVAACEAGYDCSNSNPDFGFGCIQAGTCVAGLTYTDIIQRDLGAAKFARIYADAQDIQYKISTNDWDGLQKYLEIR